MSGILLKFGKKMWLITRNTVRGALNHSESAGEFSESTGPPPRKRSGTWSKRTRDDMDIEECGGRRNSMNANISHWEPRYWREHLDNIRQMRSSKDAPVDSMGALCCVDPNSPPSTKRFQILLALMLSSQTKDNVTYGAMVNLRRHGCTVENILNSSQEEISSLIYPVGFYKRKAEYVKKTTSILHEQYADDIPTTVDELCKLPGVGPKMAHLAMDLAWGNVSGIGVDTHVHRISNRLGWCREKTSTPEQTRAEIERWLPRDLWSDINVLMVGFGQQICTPVKPKCGQCLNRDICLYARESGVSSSDDHEDINRKSSTDHK